MLFPPVASACFRRVCMTGISSPASTTSFRMARNRLPCIRFLLTRAYGIRCLPLPAYVFLWFCHSTELKMWQIEIHQTISSINTIKVYAITTSVWVCNRDSGWHLFFIRISLCIKASTQSHIEFFADEFTQLVLTVWN
jgi:hypothetical protein